MGRTYAELPAAELDYQIMEPGDTLAVGGKVWLINYRKPRGGKVTSAGERKSKGAGKEEGFRLSWLVHLFIFLPPPGRHLAVEHRPQLVRRLAHQGAQ
jgi:hypothetical protein